MLRLSQATTFVHHDCPSRTGGHLEWLTNVPMPTDGKYKARQRVRCTLNGSVWNGCTGVIRYQGSADNDPMYDDSYLVDFDPPSGGTGLMRETDLVPA